MLGSLRRAFIRAIAGRSATPVVPLVATTAIIWGLLFLIQPESRRGGLFSATTIDTMPYWAWGTSMISTGLVTLIFMSPAAVGLLVFCLSSYTATLVINIFRSSTAPWTGPIWPGTVVVVLVLAAGRIGVRQAHPHRDGGDE